MFIQLQYHSILERGIKKPANTNHTQSIAGAILLAKPSVGVLAAQNRANCLAIIEVRNSTKA